MKQIRIITTLLATTFLLLACPDIKDGHQFINFVNKSDKKIYYQIGYGNISGINKEDTVFACRKPVEGLIEDQQSLIECPLRSGGWETDLGDNIYFEIIVLDAEEFDKYKSDPCDTIQKYVPIIETYRLSLIDLQRMNWTVIYPR